MIDLDFSPSADELNRQLKRLETAIQDKAQKAAMRAAAAPLKKQMKLRAPSRTDRLAKSITHRVISGRRRRNATVLLDRGRSASEQLRPGQYALIVGPNRKVRGINPSYYGHILEFGAKPHTIKPKKNKGKTLRLSKSSATQSSFFFSKGGVSHPGVDAKGWMGNAYESVFSQVNTEFYRGLKKYLDKNT